MYALLIIVPLAAVIILNLPFRQLMKKISFSVSLALLVMQVGLVLLLPNPVFLSHPTALNSFLEFNLKADIISIVVLLCIGLVLSAALLVARYFINSTEKMFNFTNLILISLMGMNGVALAGDIFSLYVFIEITAITSYILISFDKHIYALEAVFKYIILSAVASALMLFSIALLLLLSGDTSLATIKIALANSPHSFFISFAIGIFICALFIKGGLMPFHGWLPDAYSEAPAPVSVLLAGVVTKVVGIYTLIRIIISVIGFDNSLIQILLVVGTLSIVLGALAALGQSDFKRMLAYSSISQVGYILLGLGCATPLGILGAVFHLFNHAIFKSTLFINSSALEMQVKTRNMNKMGGLAARMPITGMTAVVASLSAAGMPPLAGFWSKLIIIIALWGSGYYLYAVIGVMAGIITLAYFLSMQRRVFFGKLNEEFVNIKEADFGLVLPGIILTAITVGVGLLFPFISDLAGF